MRPLEKIVSLAARLIWPPAKKIFASGEVSWPPAKIGFAIYGRAGVLNFPQVPKARKP